jgi:hypothetical protein
VKAITLLGAATLALSLATSASAAVFAQFSPDTNAPDYTWVRSADNAGGAFATEGTLTSTSVATHFSFLDPSLAALAFLPATFNLTAAVSTPTPAVFTAGPNTWTQQNVSTTGTGFSFIYSGPSTVIAGHTLTQNVSVLLSGVFTNAYIQGMGSSGSTNLSSSSTSAVTYASDFLSFTNAVPGTAAFAFNLLGVTPTFGASAGKALNSFVGNGGGNFAVEIKTIRSFTPEPATWTMMLIGFGGVGAMIRNRRRAALEVA